jgi:hypothetical protein
MTIASGPKGTFLEPRGTGGGCGGGTTSRRDQGTRVPTRASSACAATPTMATRRPPWRASHRRLAARQTCWHRFAGVELVRLYSNLRTLDVPWIGTHRVASTAESGPLIRLCPSGRAKRRRVRDRLSEVELEQIVAGSSVSTPKHVLAERFGVSESSVKRIVRNATRVAANPAQAETLPLCDSILLSHDCNNRPEYAL